LAKFLFQTPLYRVRQTLALDGLAVSQGTLTGGLRRIGPLLEPLYEGLLARSRSANHWHMDETRWAVFVELVGKVGHRWWLWVIVTADTCCYVLDPTRSAEVPKRHLGEEAAGILNVDRYAAYKTLGPRILLAFCWAHARRDFVRILDGQPDLHTWAETWVACFDQVFEQNRKRLGVQSDPTAFRREDDGLRELLAGMREWRDRELGDPALPEAARAALESLRNHWEGLNVFVDHPEIPMDNNEAERRARNPVVGRKNYYGSGSLWSGALAAMAFTVIQSLLVNRLDPQRYLLAYFEACAANGGAAPAAIEKWLPWNLSKAKRAAWRSPEGVP